MLTVLFGGFVNVPCSMNCNLLNLLAELQLEIIDRLLRDEIG